MTDAPAEKVAFGGHIYTLDHYGFLDPPEQWNEAFAEGMARTLGIEGGLSARHWEIVHYLRHKFLDESTVPVLVEAAADNRMRLSELKRLFPTGYHRGACKIAGINQRFMFETNYWLTYETAPPPKPRFELDPMGFLKSADAWDEDFAELALAQLEPPLALTERHWQVIRYLRDFYGENHTIPTIYQTCSACDLDLDELRTLFPAGYRRCACRAAGLPFHG